MPVTLARRIRRIGLLPTTYKETKETVLRVNEDGEEITITHTKKIPVRHHSRMSNDTRAEITSKLRAEAKAKRKK
jgi:hypothetical protein